MRLALSSAAAPDASLAELLDACARRGLEALELEEGHGHGLDPGMARYGDAADAAARARTAGVRLAGFRLANPLPSRRDAADLAAFARSLGAPLLVPPDPSGVPSAGAPEADVTALVRTLGERGVAARVVLPTRGDDALPAHRLPLAWDAEPSVAHLGTVAGRLLDAAGARLGHIRLLGGGPEAGEQEGRGVGALMARLALSGYRGTVALAPSSPRYRVIWDAWLGRRGGWGCGSRRQDPALVVLEPPVEAAAAAREEGG